MDPKAGPDTAVIAPSQSPRQSSFDRSFFPEENVALKPLHGWRWWALSSWSVVAGEWTQDRNRLIRVRRASSILSGFLLAVIESSITATVLYSIDEHFDNFITATWVVLSYLLSYLGFAVIFARGSNEIGREAALIVAWVLFAAFSLGAGLSQTLNQLIVCRALQGIGGAGLFSMAMICLPQISPVTVLLSGLWPILTSQQDHYIGMMSALIGITFSVGGVIGPVIGGVIATHSTWRWAYLYNAPCAALIVPSLILCWPKGQETWSWRKMSLARLDFIGALLLLSASILLVFALQEAGAREFAWDSPTVISTLTVSGVCWIAFAAWVAAPIQKTRKSFTPILPISVVLKRPTGPAILATLLTGFPYMTVLINLPQRFQIVNGNRPIDAGVHLLPMLCSAAVGSAIGGAASAKRNSSSHTFSAATALVLLGSGLLSTISDSEAIERKQYGYQVIFGFGAGLLFSSTSVLVTYAEDHTTVAAAQGAISQARFLGGSIGLAIATIVQDHRFVQDLKGCLGAQQLTNLQKSLNTLFQLDDSSQNRVRMSYAKSFNEQMLICTYVSAAAFIIALFTLSRHPPSVAEHQARKSALEKKSETP